MTSMSDEYRKHLLPNRLIFFDLDGTIIPSTAASGRRVAISQSTYESVKNFALANFEEEKLPELDNTLCSEWYRDHGGPQGLIGQVLTNTGYSDEIKDCLSFYFNGLFNRRLTKYLQEDLKYDTVPDSHLNFLKSINTDSIMILVSYRYQSQFDFLTSLSELGLTSGNLFGPNNAFAVGAPGTSSDGSKARFVGTMWRNEIRAQRRLRLDNGKTFPPLVIEDSIRDIHFAVDIGGIFFGVGDTGENSRATLLEEIEKQSNNLNTRSRVFSSLADKNLQRRLIEECRDYKAALEQTG
jgi:hypothetical protein